MTAMRLAARAAGMKMMEASVNDVTAVIDRYFAVWNETDAATRRALISRTWSADASYVDPLLAGEGPDGIDAMIAAGQGQFPGHTVRLASGIDSHHARVRFNWEIVGPGSADPVVTGVDFAVIDADGKLQSITGFFDHVPAALLAR